MTANTITAREVKKGMVLIGADDKPVKVARDPSRGFWAGSVIIDHANGDWSCVNGDTVLTLRDRR